MSLNEFRFGMPDLVNRDNGAAHPFSGGGLFLGTVKSVGSGNTVNIRIPGLGIDATRVVSLGTTLAQRLKVGDSIICGFLANDSQELVVIGRMNVVPDVFATKQELAALNTVVAALDARVTALENEG